MTARASRFQFGVLLAVLVLAHFWLRPRLWTGAGSPDLLFVGFMLLATRASPGVGALAGLLLGVVADALTPARFGAAMVAYTVVGYLAAWGRAVFFADNVVVNAAVVFAGLWVRDLIVLLASGTPGPSLARGLLVEAPLAGLTTALATVGVLAVLRQWFRLRLDP